MTRKRAKAYVDDNNVIRFREDISPREAREIAEMLKQAFQAGLMKGLSYSTVSEAA